MSVMPETERRFIVYAYDRGILRVPAKHIQQGYFETPKDFELRIRIVNDRCGRITRKDGCGITRGEDERDIDLDLARFLMDTTQDRLTKERRVIDGWEFDVYGPPLEGLTIVEFEDSQTASAVLPPWIHRASEVTGAVNNRFLARLATQIKDNLVTDPVVEYLERYLRTR